MGNKILFTILLSLVLASCGGKSTFHEYARAGDTVAVPVGMKPDFSKDNITVTITPSSGPDIVLSATDPSIRSVINFYPDPVSNMLVSRAIGEDTSPFSQDYAYTTGVSANSDKDWFQTTIFIDLPATLPTGLTQIEINNSLGASHSATMNIIDGVGTPHNFKTTNNGLPLSSDMLDSLARANHTIIITDSSSSIPYAIEVTLTHDPDVTQNGSGKAFVINPLGYLKNLSWSDDGINMKIILMQSKDGIIDDMKDYKFYVAGTATNLQFVSVQGYDVNGNNLTGVTTSLITSN
jgi:hypothetical protein